MHDESPAGIAIKDRTLAHWREIGKIELPTRKQERQQERNLISLILAFVFFATQEGVE